ncbi:MAG: rhodanese-like domain-containing protein [Pseudomonadota bacterium]
MTARFHRHLRALLCAFPLLLGGGANAAGTQAAPGELPEALKGIKPASGVCHRDDVAPAPYPAAQGRPDLSCAIGVSGLQAILQQPNAAVIDVRLNKLFQDYHIAGALSLSYADLHSKPHWRGKAVVLVGDGKAERELYVECGRLKTLGYKNVSVLRGGMPFWLANGQSVAGRAPTASQLTHLAPAELWAESRNQDNLLVIGKERDGAQAQLPLAVPLPTTSGEAIRAVIERRRKELKNAPLSAVVLVAKAGISDQELHQAQQAILPVPLLVYADTDAALAHHITVEKAIWAAQARGPKQLACGL